MSKDRVIPPQVIKRQTDASDPMQSAWVAANAGSGKTHVLAQRVIRLLLSGIDPARILCITFTKAAAANMANRVFNDLRSWTVLDDAALDAAMHKIGVKPIDALQRQRARQLFALALETPGGLKVHTIHAFCTSLLHLFPFEANVAARFEVLDEAAEMQILERISQNVMLEAAAAPDGALGRALGAAILAGADQTFQDMVREAIRQRDQLTRWVEAAGGVPQAMAQLSRALGVEPDETAESVEAAFFDDSLIAASEWPAVAAALAAGSKADQDQSGRFTALKALTGKERLKTYMSIYCTATLDPRKNIVTKKIQTEHASLFRRLVAEQSRVCKLIARQRGIEARDRSAALFTVAHTVIARFAARKDRRGLLDYEDLIDKTLDLLKDDRAAWVHYKLDRGIHHVLIDEAQDTSPKQWEIVKALVSEFFAGQGAHDRTRTIFAVGDEKQSIFSFQGAAPREFAEMRLHFESMHRRAELPFLATEFKHSFRSGPNVLGAVDTVFARVEAYAGLTADPVPPVHESLPEAAPGLVEIWETERPDDKRAGMEGWDAPFDQTSETSPPVKLARRIARHAKLWQAQGRRPGEVLILVRRRGALFEAIIRALKNENIPVAGADRLVLTEHIAVMDLMTLADAVLLPDDDLALATVLKSPLFGLDDDALFGLAYGRDGSLHAALRMRRPDLAAQLDAIGKTARRETPFAFYADLLGAKGGRRKILARLGHEAADALDEFLNLALDYERGETPSLQGFVAWLRAAKSEVKRDMEIARDEVRVMTVHGAKGLEAPIVILADTTTPPQGWHPPRLLSLRPDSAVPSAPELLVWAGGKANDVGPMAPARETALDGARDEYRRLLYVAMTRAIDRLIVCGVDGNSKRPEGCWYDLVKDALGPGSLQEPADDGGGDVLRYRKSQDGAASVKAETEKPGVVESIALPEWLRADARTEDERGKAITPSGFAGESAPVDATDRDSARQRALRRGNIVHRLMQSLPDLPADRRADAARRYLARQKELTQAERDEIANEVLAILCDPRFAELFSLGGRAEVSIAGRLGDRPLSGQVDRLLVTPQAVLIADYKTGPAPRNLEAAQSRYGSYVAQLALYRSVLMRLYPDRPVRAALVWTETPELMEIPAAALDLALNPAASSGA